MEEDFKYHKWAMFVNDGARFSDSFRETMASQLLDKFYLMLGISNEIKRHKFYLHVGMTPLNTVTKDDYAFAIVDILNPVSLAISVTTYWRPLNNVKPETAPEINSWNNDNIEFGWCTDFDKNDYIPYLKPRNTYKKEEIDTPFDIEYDYTLYPDLSFTICCSEKVYEKEIVEIETILSSTIKDTYISELTNEEEKKESDSDCEIIGIIDFQDKDFDKATEQLIDAFKKIGQADIGKKIEKVVIE